MKHFKLIINIYNDTKQEHLVIGKTQELRLMLLKVSQ
jgi:hypothetical protein